eukprot:6777532-Alexandrium_andersonii.AAC.1
MAAARRPGRITTGSARCAALTPSAAPWPRRAAPARCAATWKICGARARTFTRPRGPRACWPTWT